MLWPVNSVVLGMSQLPAAFLIHLVLNSLALPWRAGAAALTESCRTPGIAWEKESDECCVNFMSDCFLLIFSESVAGMSQLLYSLVRVVCRGRSPCVDFVHGKLAFSRCYV